MAMRTLVLWMGSVESLACVTRRVSKVQTSTDAWRKVARHAPAEVGSVRR
jgi:hypothetical protein